MNGFIGAEGVVPVDAEIRCRERCECAEGKGRARDGYAERGGDMLGGAESVGLDLNAAPPVVILMVGLQGSGKTTTSAKIANRLTTRDRKKVLMASLDTRRPAAQEQLRKKIEAFLQQRLAPRTVGRSTWRSSRVRTNVSAASRTAGMYETSSMRIHFGRALCASPRSCSAPS